MLIGYDGAVGVSSHDNKKAGRKRPWLSSTASHGALACINDGHYCTSGIKAVVHRQRTADGSRVDGEFHQPARTAFDKVTSGGIDVQKLERRSFRVRHRPDWEPLLLHSSRKHLSAVLIGAVTAPPVWIDIPPLRLSNPNIAVCI